MIRELAFTFFIVLFVMVCVYACSNYGYSEKLIQKKEITELTKKDISVRALQLETIAVPSYGTKSQSRTQTVCRANICQFYDNSDQILDVVFEYAFSSNNKGMLSR